MKIEIEAKIKVESHDEIVELLKSGGAQLRSQQHHVDSYFVDYEQNLTRTDRALRIRRETIDGETKVVMTFKGPRDRSKFKSRQEIEVAVSDFDDTANLLEAVGFTRRLQFEKTRQMWYMNDCEICLDRLPLIGSFIEVEGPGEEEIDKVLDMLNLSGADHISVGYSRLMRDSIVEHGLDRTEIMFTQEQ